MDPAIEAMDPHLSPLRPLALKNAACPGTWICHRFAKEKICVVLKPKTRNLSIRNKYGDVCPDPLRPKGHLPQIPQNGI
jgi:hypothetical protein